ncbi:hypothetical protein ACD591_21225 [Rufibacter glacialis]|uniref:Uncharacterized protein n=1 Tax=Rufibacter glacialis TaxID=1259555 RepID=A0A5M8QHE5_9BACT|nr:hypothetical protein [Rufibacter glacialis]KAA6434404.1 hypothetical protein FOE74_09400 [Rufibacter glacialis]GGK69246.1 hypothetical protein GCM10011405_16720 [Rufibacter glacialis]
MENKEKSLNDLQEILERLETLHPEDPQTTSLVLDYLHDALDVFRFLFRNGYTEEQPSHVINYCIMKLEFAKKQIENDDVEEGLKFTKSVIMFFLKEIAIEAAAEQAENL